MGRITSIGDHAFYGCTGLTSLDVGGGMISIGEYAFAFCSALTTSVLLPGYVTVRNRRIEQRPGGCHLTHLHHRALNPDRTSISILTTPAWSIWLQAGSCIPFLSRPAERIRLRSPVPEGFMTKLVALLTALALMASFGVGPTHDSASGSSERELLSSQTGGLSSRATVWLCGVSRSP